MNKYIDTLNKDLLLTKNVIKKIEGGQDLDSYRDSLNYFNKKYKTSNLAKIQVFIYCKLWREKRKNNIKCNYYIGLIRSLKTKYNI